MSTQTDVKTVYVNGTGAMGIGQTSAYPNKSKPVRIKAIWLVSPVTAGNVTILDGSATGPITIKLDTGAVVSDDYLLFPGEGVLFQGDPYVSVFTNVTSITVFYA
jgi:hypothetical protein